MLGEVYIRSDGIMPDAELITHRMRLSHTTAKTSYSQSNRPLSGKYFHRIEIELPENKHAVKKVLHSLISRALYETHAPDSEYMFYVRDRKMREKGKAQWQSYKKSHGNGSNDDDTQSRRQGTRLQPEGRQEKITE